MEEETYNPAEAARVLGVSDRRVRQLLEAGELEGVQDGSGRWRMPQRAVHAMLEERGSPRTSSRRPNVPDREETGLAAGTPRRPASGQEDTAELIRDLVSRVADLSYRLGAAQDRLELTELTESTVREERDRLRRELEEERAERRRLAERLEELQAEPASEAGERAGPGEAEGERRPPTAAAPREQEPPDRPPWWKRIFR